MAFVDRIADARDIVEVFDLVNEFIVGLHTSADIHPIPVVLRPGSINSADDLSYWFKLSFLTRSSVEMRQKLRFQM